MRAVAQGVRAASGTIGGLAGLLQGGSGLDHVHFDFVLTQGPDITWMVKSFVCRTELSRLYELELELVCDDATAPIDEMLGAPCELLVERGELVHSVHGIIDRLDDVGPEQDRLHARVRVVPAFALLADQIDTRIFQGRTVIEILSEVLTETLGVYGREADTSTSIMRDYSARDYCTQFRESTLDFCCRLMEEEGIAYYFASDDEGRREKLVLIDNNNDYPEVELGVGDEVPIIDHDAEEADRESIRGLLWRQQRRINKVAGRAYNFKAADAFDEHEESVDEPHHHHPQELYLHDLRRQITDDPVEDPEATSFDGTGLLQRQRIVEQVLQEHRAQTKLGHGSGNVTGFQPGRCFKLVEHHRADIDGASFLLVRVVHRGEHNEEAGAGSTVYVNEFTVIPKEHEFRPPQQTRRAKIYGPQLAVVVGREGGEEIHTDPFGRVKIQFHHDRRQERNAAASCWVRVMQPWAGPSWGSFFIPRVGMEVVVQFVDGDPDQPMIVGSVYNSVNMPPYAMPDQKTKSTIKTSSVGAEGYNELTFEDAAGSEQIIIHAQKDFNETVEHNHTTTVHNCQTIGVDADQSTSVKGNQSNTVEKNQTESVTGNVTITVQGERSHTITKKETVTLKDALELTVGNTERHQVTKKLTEEFDDGRVTTVTNGDTETIATGDKKVTVSVGALLASSKTKFEIKQNDTHVLLFEDKADLTTSTNFKITNNKVTVESVENVLKLTGTDEIFLGCGEASIKLKKDGTIEITGNTKVAITGGGATGEWSSSGVKQNGNMLDLSADAVAKLQGTMVKIN